MKRADTYTLGAYPGVTITTMQDDDGKISFNIMGENLDDCRAVEKLMLAVTQDMGPVKTSERIIGREHSSKKLRRKR